MGCYIDQLYIGDNRQSKGVVYHHRGAYLLAQGNALTTCCGQTCCLSMDIAHVSLQQLVFPMDLSAITGTRNVFAAGA